MKYYSTNNKNLLYSAKEAIFQGLPEDNGLFMPENIPRLDQEFLDTLGSATLQEIGFTVVRPFFGNDIPDEELMQIVRNTLNFPIPLVSIELNIATLELYHGPTLAFKDVGAGFLAGCLDYLSKKEDKRITVLVATSGDTGSAVANGFYNKENVDVVILYPSGKISDIQSQQMTTLGNNITVLEVDGTFDDCQKMVKDAFLDSQLKKQLNLTSANSINIARFISQAIYYFHGFSQLEDHKDVVLSVPSGNFGNLTAGLFAQRMGLPISHFVASTNVNDVVPGYLTSGVFTSKASVSTVSNAMDVGNPSNFARILDLFGSDHQQITKSITGFSYTDKETLSCIRDVYERSGYVLDPHGAVGYLGLKDFQRTHPRSNGIFLETAHPYKFGRTVTQSIDQDLDVPPQLAGLESKSTTTIPIQAGYPALKEYLES